MFALDEVVVVCGLKAGLDPPKREKVQKKYTILIKYHAEHSYYVGGHKRFCSPASRQSANIFKSRVINLSPPSDIGGESSQFMV